MYISHVSIRNFRSLKSVDIDFHPGKNVIIGKNNSGKSNVIKALNYVLGEKFPTYIQFVKDDFYGTNTDEDLEYEKFFLILVELKHNNQDGDDFNINELLEYKRNIGYITVDRNINHLSADGSDINIAYQYQDESQRSNVKWDSAETMSYLIKTAHSISLYLRVEREDGTAKYGMIINGKLSNYFVFGINKNLRDALITSSIIPAVRSPYSELKINNYSWYAKMLRELWTNLPSEKHDGLKRIKEMLMEFADLGFSCAMEQITSDVSNTINANSVEIHLLTHNIEDMYKNAQIYVDDSGLKTSLESKGTGTQSSVVISLFLYYCKVMHKSGSLLAIEEPECYLHPHARRSLSSNLDSFVSEQNGGKPANQIILTTHSAEFIKGTKFENIVLIKKSKFGGSECAAMKDNTIINNYRQKVEKIINSRNAELFFADCVILVEGGEEHLLPLIAERIDDDSNKKDNPLDRYNISVINVTGKSHFPEYSHLPSDLGIKYYIIADFDILSKNADIEKLKHHSEMLDLSVDGELSREECLNWIHGLIANQTTVDKKKIYERCTRPENHDAEYFYNMIEECCTSNTVTAELKQLWRSLKERRSPKITYESLIKGRKESDKRKLDSIFLALLKEDHLYILKKGELENYYTEKTRQIPGGKEVKALGIADAVSIEKEGTIQDYMDISEYQTVIKDAIDACRMDI
ncbi:MAG: AAA family ATPase [Methanocorpusculum sp.]|nr:AAA family ATPase [Methanocorpusculum sp.]HJJ44873.1 AAA family ATPase [Methanocorpusculum sp.]